jgi:hypothetical protein
MIVSMRLVCARRLADSYEMDVIIHFRFVYIRAQNLLVDCDLNAVLGACTLEKLLRRGFTGAVQILG